MKKLTLSLLFILLSATAVFANINVTITNKTGKTIKEVYIAPSTSEYWGDNQIRPTQQITNNRFRRITLQGFDQEQLFDIRIIDAEDNRYTVWAVNIKETPNITITKEHLEGGEETTDTVQESTSSTTSNQTATGHTGTNPVTNTSTGNQTTSTNSSTAQTTAQATETSGGSYEDGYKEGYMEGFTEAFGSGYEAGYLAALRAFREAQLEKQRQEQ